MLQSVVKTDIAKTINALSVVLDAASMPVNDQNKLIGLVQASQQADEADDQELGGAPAVAAYKSHSSNIVDVLEDLKEKAEANARHNFEMLAQSLDDQSKQDTKDLDAQKSA